MFRIGAVVLTLVGLAPVVVVGQSSQGRTFNVGVHVGSRLAVPGPEGYNVGISTIDSTVQVDTTRTGAALLAGANVTVFPFQMPELHWFGFMLNLNLINILEVSNSRLADLGAGIGFAFRLHPRFSIGLTVNQYEISQPRSWVVDAAGEQIPNSEGNPAASLDEAAGDLYGTTNTRRLGIWWVFMF